MKCDDGVEEVRLIYVFSWCGFVDWRDGDELEVLSDFCGGVVKVSITIIEIRVECDVGVRFFGFCYWGVRWVISRLV